MQHEARTGDWPPDMGRWTRPGGSDISSGVSKIRRSFLAEKKGRAIQAELISSAQRLERSRCVLEMEDGSPCHSPQRTLSVRWGQWRDDAGEVGGKPNSESAVYIL